MKFRNLKEGKKYEIIGSKDYDCIKVTLIDGLLWEIKKNFWLDATQYEVHELDFVEIPEYVSFGKAIEYMKNGGQAKFDGQEFLYKFYYGELYAYNKHLKGCHAVFSRYMLEPKWILL